MKKNKNLYFMSIFCLLIAFQCIGCLEGPGHSFDVYNNRNETIIIDYRRDVSNQTNKRFEVGPHQKKEHFTGGFRRKKRKPSEFLDYVKVTEEDGTVLFDIHGEALDVAFKVVEEAEYFILYRLDVN